MGLFQAELLIEKKLWPHFVCQRQCGGFTIKVHVIVTYVQYEGMVGLDHSWVHVHFLWESLAAVFSQLRPGDSLWAHFISRADGLRWETIVSCNKRTRERSQRLRLRSSVALCCAIDHTDSVLLWLLHSFCASCKFMRKSQVNVTEVTIVSLEMNIPGSITWWQ